MNIKATIDGPTGHVALSMNMTDSNPAHDPIVQLEIWSDPEGFNPEIEQERKLVAVHACGLAELSNAVTALSAARSRLR